MIGNDYQKKLVESELRKQTVKILFTLVVNSILAIVNECN